jgi:Na+/proline symporter
MFTILILFLVAYFAFFTYLSFRLTSGYDSGKLGYLVANRTAGFWESSLAIASSWALGGALFGVVEFAYKGGLPGFVWYIVPQILGIICFGWFSKFINSNIPNGYTLSDFIKFKFGKTVAGFYQICLITGAIGLTILTTTSLTKFLTYMQVPNVSIITALVTFGTVCYALKGGLKTNLIIGSIQMVLLLAFCLVILFTGLTTNSWDSLVAGTTGAVGYTGLFDTKLLNTGFLSLGIMSLSGLLGNQCFYQKTFAQQTTNNSSKSFWLAAFFWAIVPATFGLVTFIAVGSGIKTSDIANMHLAWFGSAIGPVALVAFGVLVLNAASNCLDTQSNAIGSIVSNDWIKDESKSVFYSRLSIIVVAIICWGVSTLNLSMSMIMLAYGIFRVLLFFITILAVSTNLLNRVGMITTIFIIAPIALYLNFNDAKTAASIIAWLGTPVLALTVSYISNCCKHTTSST